MKKLLEIVVKIISIVVITAVSGPTTLVLLAARKIKEFLVSAAVRLNTIVYQVLIPIWESEDIFSPRKVLDELESRRGKLLEKRAKEDEDFQRVQKRFEDAMRRIDELDGRVSEALDRETKDLHKFHSLMEELRDKR